MCTNLGAGGSYSGGGGNNTNQGDWRKSVNFDKSDRFFGDIHQVSNKRFEIKSQTPNSDEAIIFTNNLAVVKGNPVLITDNNKAVYLKDFNIRKATVEYDDAPGTYIDTFAVKINKSISKSILSKKTLMDIALIRQIPLTASLRLRKHRKSKENELA